MGGFPVHRRCIRASALAGVHGSAAAFVGVAPLTSSQLCPVLFPALLGLRDESRLTHFQSTWPLLHVVTVVPFTVDGADRPK